MIVQKHASWGRKFVALPYARSPHTNAQDSLKMDGCYSIHTEEILNPAYEFLGAEMNKTVAGKLLFLARLFTR